jgi:hypothetical protein
MFAFAIAVVLNAVATAAAAPTPVVIVDNPREIRAMVGAGADGTFTPSPEEAEGPRRDLVRFVDARLQREKNKYGREQLNRIRKQADRYFWYCGGYTQKGHKSLFCTFVLSPPPGQAGPGPKAFPVIKDGGTSVCRCHYDVESRKVVRLDWNGEA